MIWAFLSRTEQHVLCCCCLFLECHWKVSDRKKQECNFFFRQWFNTVVHLKLNWVQFKNIEKCFRAKIKNIWFRLHLLPTTTIYTCTILEKCVKMKIITTVKEKKNKFKWTVPSFVRPSSGKQDPQASTSQPYTRSLKMDPPLERFVMWRSPETSHRQTVQTSQETNTFKSPSSSKKLAVSEYNKVCGR